jgi:hypothetical protein
MEIHRAGIFNDRLLHFLSTIQAAKRQLRLLTTSNSTQTLLVSQIGLCDVLLNEIRAIRLSLERRLLRHRSSVRHGAFAAKHNRGRSLARPIVQQRHPAKRSRLER